MPACSEREHTLIKSFKGAGMSTLLQSRTSSISNNSFGSGEVEPNNIYSERGKPIRAKKSRIVELQALIRAGALAKENSGGNTVAPQAKGRVSKSHLFHVN